MGRRPNKEIFQNISLEFSNGQKVNYSLNDMPYPNKLDWNEEVLIMPPNNPVSKFVNIMATSEKDDGIVTHGFSDIQLFGCNLKTSSSGS